MNKFFTLIFRKLLFTFCSLVFVTLVNAQLVRSGKDGTPIKITVTNPKKEPVPFATITVTDRNDSLRSEKKVADSSGVALFILSKGVQYIISISAINYQPQEKGITVTDNQKTFSLSLESAAKTLGGVVVTSSKPLMRRKMIKPLLIRRILLRPLPTVMK
ncbi:MAG: carboxypeptidase regulatory-like domain-containing protein [Bacteroidota bacterium]